MIAGFLTELQNIPAPCGNSPQARPSLSLRGKALMAQKLAGQQTPSAQWQERQKQHNPQGLCIEWHSRRAAYSKEGGSVGTGSPPCTSRREVPTREWKAFLKGRLPTRGDPKVMHLTSACGHRKAAHVAPATAALP